ncbi:diiron oxygenase [Dactylosporangium sp. NPDC051541]|uniref:diiron oxygenase n=1 Tax=Dactylosporangium sp. NPDC051541 TaxID=3363977 RepID=UPI0037B96B27
MYRRRALAPLFVFDDGLAATAATVAEYDSRFRRWDRRASVRAKPRRSLDAPGRDQLYFPPELVPAAAHPLVAARGPTAGHALLVHRLHQYLGFTIELEDLAVIPVAASISRGRSGLELPEAMRADAFKIVTDEAWHAQFSYDLQRQVAQETGVAPRTPEVAEFVDRLDAVRHRLPPAVRGVESLLFAVVSETLISTILADLPHDQRLPGAVRSVVADHAEDEGRHHVYFRTLLGHLWPALTAEQRRLVGPHLPEMIFAFLEPDRRALAFALRDLGLSTAAIEQVIAESLPRADVNRGVALGAATTVRYLRETGVLDDPATFDRFAESGLLLS